MGVDVDGSGHSKEGFDPRNEEEEPREEGPKPGVQVLPGSGGSGEVPGVTEGGQDEEGEAVAEAVLGVEHDLAARLAVVVDVVPGVEDLRKES